MVEATNAHLGVADVVELGKAKAAIVVSKDRRELDRYIPLASTSASVDDGLGGLNSAEASREGEEKLIVGGGVKAADVDVAVARDAVLEALLEALHLTGRSEDGGNSLRDRRLPIQKSNQGRLRDGGRDRLGGVREAKRLGRRSVVGRAVVACNAGASLTVTKAGPVGSSRSGLVGGVRATAVLETGNEVRVTTISATSSRLEVGATRGVRHHAHGHAHTVVGCSKAGPTVTMTLNESLVVPLKRHRTPLKTMKTAHVVAVAHRSNPRTARTNRHGVAHVDAVKVAVKVHTPKRAHESARVSSWTTVAIVTIGLAIDVGGALAIGSSSTIGRATNIGLLSRVASDVALHC